MLIAVYLVVILLFNNISICNLLFTIYLARLQLFNTDYGDYHAFLDLLGNRNIFNRTI